MFTPNFVLPVAERVKQEPRQPLSDLPEADRVVESNDAEVQYSLYLYHIVLNSTFIYLREMISPNDLFWKETAN